MSTVKLTPEQEAQVENLFLNARNLANTMGRIMETYESAEQAGAVAMILGAIILCDLEAERFATFEEAADHYVSGAYALHKDLHSSEGKVVQ